MSPTNIGCMGSRQVFSGSCRKVAIEMLRMLGWLNFGTIRPIRPGLQAPIEIKPGPTHTKLYFALIPVKRADLLSASRGGRKMHVVRSMFAGSSIIRWWKRPPGTNSQKFCATPVTVAHRGLQPISPKRVAQPGTSVCATVFGSSLRVTEPRRGGWHTFSGEGGSSVRRRPPTRAYTRERTHRRRAGAHMRDVF